MVCERIFIILSKKWVKQHQGPSKIIYLWYWPSVLLYDFYSTHGSGQERRKQIGRKPRIDLKRLCAFGNGFFWCLPFSLYHSPQDAAHSSRCLSGQPSLPLATLQLLWASRCWNKGSSFLRHGLRLEGSLFVEDSFTSFHMRSSSSAVRSKLKCHPLQRELPGSQLLHTSSPPSPQLLLYFGLWLVSFKTLLKWFYLFSI